MNKEPIMKGRWNGRAMVPIISQMIVFAGQIEPQLAPVFNHARFQKQHLRRRTG